MHDPNWDNDFKSNKLTLEELKKIKGFEKIDNIKGEEMINDAFALARMILDIID